MNNLDKLKKLIQQADELLTQNVTTSLPEFKAWHLNVKRFLERTFGKESTELKSFKEEISFSFIPLIDFISFGSDDVVSSSSSQEDIKICKKGITETKLILQTYLEEIEEELNAHYADKNHNNIDLTKVFIVHGHNGEIKQKVARIVEKQGLEAIILDEQVSGGQTIIEKLEYYINEQGVGAAICLFTADDTGKANKEEEQKPRARQNVVFETGLCIGKLGRERIVVIAENGIELPSDMQGVVYINDNWEFGMLKELKNMSFEIDLNKI